MQICSGRFLGAGPPCCQSRGSSRGAALCFLPVSEAFGGSGAALSGETENKEAADTVTAFGFKFQP